MPTDLQAHLAQLWVADTHEHAMSESHWLSRGPADVLCDLFWHYSQKDLISAGASEESIQRLIAGSDVSLEDRWRAIEPAWQAMRYTGYGEALRLQAKYCYGIEELTPDAFRQAQPRLAALRAAGARYRFLHDVARIDHMQVNEFVFPAAADPVAPDFFLYDLSFATPCWGYFPPEHLGAEIRDLASLRRGIEAYFARYAPLAISVKNQMAYERPLSWRPRSDADAQNALAAVLQDKDPRKAGEEAQLCIGDWCLARAVELTIQYSLPMKIHTGYYYNNNAMPLDRTRPGQLCPLFIAYPQARFVLMHAAYPYEHELTAIAKHFSNVRLDLCWAWAMDPLSTANFFRRYLHSAPINKLMAFGGDTHTPTASYAFLLQMKHWLAKALQAEIDEGFLKETQACEITDRVLHQNAYDCFDIAGKQALMRTYGAG